MRQLRSNFNQASGGATRTSSVKRRTLAERGTRRARQAWLREGKYHTRRQLCSRWPRRNGWCDPGHKAGTSRPACFSIGCVPVHTTYKQTKKKKPVTVTVIACCHGLACNRSSLVRRVARVPLSLWSSGGRARTDQWRRGNWHTGQTRAIALARTIFYELLFLAAHPFSIAVSGHS